MLSAFLEKKGIKVNYIESNNKLSDIRQFREELKSKNITEINIIDPVDNWLEKRIGTIAKNYKLNAFSSPLFINSKEDLSTFFRADKKSFFKLLFTNSNGKSSISYWKMGKNPWEESGPTIRITVKSIPRKNTSEHPFSRGNLFWTESVTYTEKHFKNNPGQLSKDPIYPISHKQAENWFVQFLEYRFFDFGIYEDSIVKQQSF